MAISRQATADDQEARHPNITREDFERLQKQPLWRIGAAILYTMGRRSRIEGKEAEYTGHNRLFARIFQYAIEANKVGDLKIRAYDETKYPDRKSGSTYDDFPFAQVTLKTL